MKVSLIRRGITEQTCPIWKAVGTGMCPKAACYPSNPSIAVAPHVSSWKKSGSQKSKSDDIQSSLSRQIAIISVYRIPPHGAPTVIMSAPFSFLRSLRFSQCARATTRADAPKRPFSIARAFKQKENPQPVDSPEFVSILDGPPKIVRKGRRHGPGLIILAIIPVTAFALGSWQVQRLGWKSELIAKFEDRLVRDPLPLPPIIDPEAIHDFDFRRVMASGVFRHDQEMLIGPRMRDGQDGYMVVTPLERKDASTILVNRGWISKKHRDQRSRPNGLPKGEVTVEGLLREPWKKNMFTPENRPDKGEFYFPDVKQMAELTGSQPVWVEATLGKLVFGSTPSAGD
ncbi:Cytochrome oxidase assembly protein shy1 [Emericellopsis cladophorae]|uniref:SURF1-like protein n=1 Tax=Emericellopsis cladophorae TaxID=2686198 RepID=A0A9Q0BB44_9HYPO|nr:Cytochrome oxidase assembly protein shy1 [Emericellopsis cladophorae]KAI6778897.1 Cytochrome oxidase assembly protein shy1 [Emericellopsis cladophorae]